MALTNLMIMPLEAAAVVAFNFKSLFWREKNFENTKNLDFFPPDQSQKLLVLHNGLALKAAAATTTIIIKL